ncbi:MAG: hypothetical protein AAGF47_02335 [Planctomycetota bacterium]
MAKPLLDHAGRVLTAQFHVTSDPEVLPELRPATDNGTIDDALKLGPEVRGSGAVSRDHVLGAGLGLVEDGLELGGDLWEQWGVADAAR